MIKTVVDHLYVGLMVVGLLAGMFLYRVVARRFVEWLVARPWFGRPLVNQADHALESE